MVLRNDRGHLLAAAGWNLLHWDSTQVELLAMQYIPLLIQDWMFDAAGLIVEGDNRAIIRAMQRLTEARHWETHPLSATVDSESSGFGGGGGRGSPSPGGGSRLVLPSSSRGASWADLVAAEDDGCSSDSGTSAYSLASSVEKSSSLRVCSSLVPLRPQDTSLSSDVSASPPLLFGAALPDPAFEEGSAGEESMNSPVECMDTSGDGSNDSPHSCRSTSMMVEPSLFSGDRSPFALGAPGDLIGPADYSCAVRNSLAVSSGPHLSLQHGPPLLPVLSDQVSDGSCQLVNVSCLGAHPALSPPVSLALLPTPSSHPLSPPSPALITPLGAPHMAFSPQHSEPSIPASSQSCSSARPVPWPGVSPRSVLGCPKAGPKFQKASDRASSPPVSAAKASPPPSSPARNASSTPSAWDKVQFTPLTALNKEDFTDMDGISLIPVKDAIASNAAKLERALVAQFVGRRLPFHLLLAELKRLWGHFGEFQVITTAPSSFICLFHSAEARDAVLQKGPWIILGSLLGMVRWSPDYIPNSLSGLQASIWIRLPQLPLLYWDIDNLTRMANFVGEPLWLDEHTSSWGRSSYARMCVRLNLSKPLLPGIWIKGLHGRFFQKIEYEGISNFCFSCGLVGHTQDSCPSHWNSPAPCNVDSSNAPVGNADQTVSPPPASPPLLGIRALLRRLHSHPPPYPPRSFGPHQG
ncbi:hypothetical protein M5K25_009009 [Dendrobium thyrsiflorum]|uniref:CCHC-type domain-containing protein n=1 Tax=Dendrobium thyrsiflorum TaxID=117978 RepID=A0ABD0V4G0_DENTH